MMNRLKLYWRYWNSIAKYEHPLYKEYLYLKDRFKMWNKARAFNKAKRLAKARHKSDGKTYYVLPDDKNVPRSFNNKEIALLKKHKLMDKKVNCLDLYKEAMFVANAQTCK